MRSSVLVRAGLGGATWDLLDMLDACESVLERDSLPMLDESWVAPYESNRGERLDSGLWT